MARRLAEQLSLALGVASATLLWTPSAVAEEPTGPAIAYKPDEFPPAGTGSSTVLAGAGLLVGSYGAAFATSYLWPDAPNAQGLRIPVAGPWMALAGAKCGADEAGCGSMLVVVRSVLTTLSGLGQAAGLLVMAEGLFLPSAPDSTATWHPIAPGTTLDVSLRAAGMRSLAADGPPALPPVYVSPMLSETAVGFSIGGAF